MHSASSTSLRPRTACGLDFLFPSDSYCLRAMKIYPHCAEAIVYGTVNCPHCGKDVHLPYRHKDVPLGKRKLTANFLILVLVFFWCSHLSLTSNHLYMHHGTSGVYSAHGSGAGEPVFLVISGISWLLRQLSPVHASWATHARVRDFAHLPDSSCRINRNQLVCQQYSWCSLRPIISSRPTESLAAENSDTLPPSLSFRAALMGA